MELNWAVPAIDAAFWGRLGAIMVINLILSGDNAVVIAMAVSKLPPAQKKWGFILGSVSTIALRIVLASFVVYLLMIPFLKLAGGVLVLCMAVKLFIEGHEEGIEAAPGVWAAVWIILVADFVMSVDNVLSVACVADGGMFLILIGFVAGIPLVFLGSALLSSLVNRFPISITVAAAVLSYVGADMVMGDKWVIGLFTEGGAFAHLDWVEAVIAAEHDIEEWGMKGLIAWPVKIFVTVGVIVAGELWLKKGAGHKPDEALHA